MNENRGYAAIGLVSPKTNANVGAVLRAARCFDAKMVVAQGQRYTRASTDTTAAYRHLPLLQVPDVSGLHDAVPFDCIPVAVEFLPWARSLEAYVHPERAFYIFGPEDGTLGKDVLGWCRDVVKVPTHWCLNLAMTVNVVLYDRVAKQLRESKKRGLVVAA